jgi:phosphatidylethanolamine-binding protein (PEBP) family uncharacterized protein
LLFFFKPPFMPGEKEDLLVRSVAFSHNGHIPKKYSCDGDNINPPLEISNVPSNAKSLALIMEDPDAPRGVFDHWLLWNIPPNAAIAENANPGCREQIVLATRAMEVRARRRAFIVIISKCLRSTVNWTCKRERIRHNSRKP